MTRRFDNVPNIDQVFGMGKTEFGVHFGHECSKLLSTWRDSKGRPSVDIGFLESLSRVRSIALYPPESSLSAGNAELRSWRCL